MLVHFDLHNFLITFEVHARAWDVSHLYFFKKRAIIFVKYQVYDNVRTSHRSARPSICAMLFIRNLVSIARSENISFYLSTLLYIGEPKVLTCDCTCSIVLILVDCFGLRYWQRRWIKFEFEFVFPNIVNHCYNVRELLSYGFFFFFFFWSWRIPWTQFPIVWKFTWNEYSA